MSNKLAVIYARFSSHSQIEQSIEDQLRECYEYANGNDLVVVHEYIDRALSGTSDKRPEFQQMIEDSKKKEFDYVLVYQLDRFARNRYDGATYKAKLKKNDVRIISAKEDISTDASGVLVESVLEGFERSNGHTNKSRIKVANQCKIKDTAYNSYKREWLCLF